jgi:hypothetical protein
MNKEFMAEFFTRIFDEMQSPDFYVNMGTFPRKYMAEIDLLSAADMIVGINSLPDVSTLLSQFFELIWNVKPEWEREDEKKSLLDYYVSHSENYGRILKKAKQTSPREKLLVAIMVFTRFHCLRDLQVPFSAEKRFDKRDETSVAIGSSADCKAVNDDAVAIGSYANVTDSKKECDDEIKIEELSEDVVVARFVMRQMGTI